MNEEWNFFFFTLVEHICKIRKNRFANYDVHEIDVFGVNDVNDEKVKPMVEFLSLLLRDL